LEWEKFMSKLVVTAYALPEGPIFTATGRDAWALLELCRSGLQGCTTNESPGPRWSAYIFNLKRKHGLHIETLHEVHRGQFPGSHARYILRSRIEIVSQSDTLRSVAA
jgi:hypothetical protein